MAITDARASDEIYPQSSVSGFHFKIYVVQFDTTSSPLVYCQDMSLNGTYLNEALIGKNRTVLLTHGDKLGTERKYITPRYLTQIAMCATIYFTYFQSMLGDSSTSELAYMSGLELDGYRVSSRIIGCGSFGEVRMAVNLETNQHVACKISKVIKKKNFQPATEVNILTNLSHVSFDSTQLKSSNMRQPNIISIHRTSYFNGHTLIFEDL